MNARTNFAPSFQALGLAMLMAVFVVSCASRRNTPPVAALPTNAPFAGEIRAFAMSDLTNLPPRDATLFIGSSSIRLWKTLAQDFPNLQVINRGFGGSQIIDSVNYAERIVIPYRPRRIVFYAGGNDINAGKSPQQVAADFQSFVAKVHAALPRTPIAYISIAPNPARWAQVEKVRQANRLIEDFTKQNKHLSFINVFPHMLGSDGLPRPEIFVADRLHMNAQGYALWKRVVGEHLEH